MVFHTCQSSARGLPVMGGSCSEERGLPELITGIHSTGLGAALPHGLYMGAAPGGWISAPGVFLLTRSQHHIAGVRRSAGPLSEVPPLACRSGVMGLRLRGWSRVTGKVLNTGSMHTVQ